MSKTQTDSSDGTRLAAGALTMRGVIFCCLAGAAPLAAVLFNVPYAVGWGGIGRRLGVPARDDLSHDLLGRLHRDGERVTAAGGFYSFISHGFGRVVGLGAAFTITAAYIVFAAAQVGVFTFFLSVFTEGWFGFTFPVLPVYIAVIAAVFALAFFKVQITAKVLGVAMIAEVICILIFGFAVLFQGGGPEGLGVSEVFDVTALKDNPAALAAAPLTDGFVTAAIGVALFGAFWSWVGFEMAPNYAEESREPKKSMGPRPTARYRPRRLLHLAAWMITAAWGPSNIGIAQAGAFNGEYGNIIYPVADEFVGTWLSRLIELLAVTGDFACFCAFFNTSARYLFSMGREGILPRALGTTHPKHHSPVVASVVVTVIVALWAGGFYLYDSTLSGALFKLGTFGPVAFVFGILGIQALCSFAIIWYFWTKARDGWSWWKTGLAPLIGGLVQIPVMYIVNHESGTLGGSAPILTYMVWIIAAIFALGCAVALYFRATSPAKYASIWALRPRGVAGV